jgi:hypothetical protein
MSGLLPTRPAESLGIDPWQRGCSEGTSVLADGEVKMLTQPLLEFNVLHADHLSQGIARQVEAKMMPPMLGL